jgi:lipopolysaccharide export system permease protein
MKILDRYLGINIIQTTFLVLLMLMGLSIVIALIRELGAIGHGDYRLLGALEYVILDLPEQLYIFFPVAGLLGVLLGLGTLANHNELTVMRGSSMSVSDISWSVLKAALLMLIIVTLLGEGLAPMAEHAAESKKALLTSRGQALKTTNGTWIRDGQNFLYLRAIISNHHIEGVSRYEFDTQQNLTTVSYAQRGLYDHHRWLMLDVVESEVTPTKITTQQSAQADWQLSLNPDLLRISEIDPDEMSLPQLHNYLSYLKSNNLDTSDYALSFWQRITQPLATLVMMWLAIPFVFGPLRSATMGLRILAGAAMGFVFITLNQFFGPLTAVYQLPPLIAALIPIALFALVAYWLQQRVR